MINYIDRQIIGILKPDLSAQLGWTEDGYANIVEAFQFAYALGYLFGGRFMDLVGVRRGLPLAAGLWSVFCATHGLMRSVAGFSAARLGLGLGDGGNFPGAIRTVGDWFPVRERALATGLFNSASNVGAIICPILVPALAIRFGWPAAFYVTGSFRIGLGCAVDPRLPISRSDHTGCLGAPEREFILEGRTAGPLAHRMPFGQVVRSRPAPA